MNNFVDLVVDEQDLALSSMSEVRRSPPTPLIVNTTTTTTTTTRLNFVGDSSNKSSLSSSTSSLVSSSNSTSILNPILIAPPPTPLNQSTQQQQQPHHLNHHHHQQQQQHASSIYPPPIISASLSSSSTFSTNPNSNNIVPQLLHHSRSLLPMHHLASSSSFGCTTATTTATTPPTTLISKLADSLTDDSRIQSRFYDTSISSTSGHVFGNGEHVRFSNRRECKSTSDESYTLELEEQSLIASATNKIEKMTAASAAAAATAIHVDSKLYKLSAGQFGFNPISAGLMSASLLNNKSSGFSRLGRLKSSRDFSAARKAPKRLVGQNKVFIDSMKKPKHNDYNNNKKLFTAVSNNDSKAVNELLESNSYDVNCVDDKQRTCLHIASSRGYIDIVRILLDHGASPNVRDCVNNLPIHLAIISSHVQVVTLLLEAGTEISSLDLNGKTVLHLAGTRLRWLLSDENHKASPKLKFEAIMIMNMIKEYLRRKKSQPTNDLDTLAFQLENSFNLDDINSISHQLLNQFETLRINNLEPSSSSSMASPK